MRRRQSPVAALARMYASGAQLGLMWLSTAAASTAVIQERTSTLATPRAMLDRDKRAEARTMVGEKLDAAVESTADLMQALASDPLRMPALWNEWLGAQYAFANAAARCAGARSPHQLRDRMRVASAAGAKAAGAWAAASAASNQTALAALAPYHRRAKANAKRLKGVARSR